MPFPYGWTPPGPSPSLYQDDMGLPFPPPERPKEDMIRVGKWEVGNDCESLCFFSLVRWTSPLCKWRPIVLEPNDRLPLRDIPAGPGHCMFKT